MTIPDSSDAMIIELLVYTTEFLDSVRSLLGQVMILLCQNPSVNVASDRGVSLNLALLQIQL
jgi:hypothetical protein